MERAWGECGALTRATLRALGIRNASSHSDGQTAITHSRRRVSAVGSSISEVQRVVDPKVIPTTRSYIEGDRMNQRPVMEMA